jgi:hypothetical protein
MSLEVWMAHRLTALYCLLQVVTTCSNSCSDGRSNIRLINLTYRTGVHIFSVNRTVPYLPKW